jgi:hypothetical protein
MRRLLYTLACLVWASSAVAAIELSEERAVEASRVFVASCLRHPFDNSKVSQWASQNGFSASSSPLLRSAQQTFERKSADKKLWVAIAPKQQCHVRVAEASLSRALAELERLVQGAAQYNAQVTQHTNRKVPNAPEGARQVAYLLKFGGEGVGLLWQVMSFPDEKGTHEVTFSTGVVRVEP